MLLSSVPPTNNTALDRLRRKVRERREGEKERGREASSTHTKHSLLPESIFKPCLEFNLALQLSSYHLTTPKMSLNFSLEKSNDVMITSFGDVTHHHVGGDDHSDKAHG